jgi:hypothetical protein
VQYRAVQGSAVQGSALRSCGDGAESQQDTTRHTFSFRIHSAALG